MAQAGRKPKPAELKEAEGNPGGRPIPEQPDLGAMDALAPDWLDGVGAAVWMRVAGELSALGLLKDADRDLMASYCQHVSNGMQYQRILNEEGLMKDGKAHPAASEMRQQFYQARLIASELGITPTARARGILPVPTGKDRDEWTVG